jgi:hypothetical protein
MAGEKRYITAYNGTNQLTVSPAWAADPDAAGNILFEVVSSEEGYTASVVGTINSTLGAIDTAAATGAVSDAKVAMAYIKQIVNNVDASASTLGSIYAILGNPAASITAMINALVSYVDTVVAGRYQPAATTIDLNQAAATYDLFTGTTQPVILESLIIAMPNEAAGGALTSISIQTDDATPQVLVTAVQGAVASLTAEAQLYWEGKIRLAVGKKIQLTIAGGAHGSAYVCNVNVGLRTVVSGGYLS